MLSFIPQQHRVIRLPLYRTQKEKVKFSLNISTKGNKIVMHQIIEDLGNK